jgi:glycosyltransferase involved in cell wall biosynthesis
LLFVVVCAAFGLYGAYPTAATPAGDDRSDQPGIRILVGVLISTSASLMVPLGPRQQVALWLTFVVVNVTSRLLLAPVTRRRSGDAERWLLVGDGSIAEQLNSHEPLLGRAMVVGSIAPGEIRTQSLQRSTGLELLDRHRPDRVVISSEYSDEKELQGRVSTFTSLGVPVSVLPRSLTQFQAHNATAPRKVGGLLLVDVQALKANGGVTYKGPDRRCDRAVKVSVVVPALNEARNIGYVLRRLPDGLHEVILVDGKSTDDTIEVARRAYPDLRVKIQKGRGKGDALRVGFAAVTGNIVVTLDADGSTDPAEIPRFVAALEHADFAKGSRFAKGGGSNDITLVRKLGNAFLSGTCNRLQRTSFTDLCYGYNAFWTRCLPFIALDAPGFEVETLINLRVAAAGMRIVEVPSYERRRLSGESNLHTFRDGFRVLKTILSETRRTRAFRKGEVRVLQATAKPSALPSGDPATPGTGLSVSVVVATYDEGRWETLVSCVESIRNQTVAPVDVIVVVDHNRALLERATSAFPWATVIANERSRGLAGARNAGIVAAGGDVVAFIDDDANADPDWLHGLLSCFEHANTVGAGGVILPVWDERVRPGWVPPELHWVYGCSYAGLPTRLAPIRNPIGANMAVRASVLRQVGGFREAGAGHAPRELKARGFVRAAGNVPDDTDLAIRVKQQIPTAVWLHQPSARVHHHVTAQRTAPGYLVRRSFEEGVGKALLVRLLGAEQSLASERRYVAGVLPGAALRELRSLVHGDATALLRVVAMVVATGAAAVGYGRAMATPWSGR